MRNPKSLSDLFLNFSEEEKREIYLDVAQKATERQLETLEKYMEQIELQQEPKVLEGEYQFQPDQQKLFRNLQSAADYCISFGIRNYVIQDGNTVDGQYVVQVSYQRNQ